MLLLLDTGLRIDEALRLDRGNVDLHNCMARVRGKGNRERLVPMSLECRKRLYLLLKAATADPVFPPTAASLSPHATPTATSRPFARLPATATRRTERLEGRDGVHYGNDQEEDG